MTSLFDDEHLDGRLFDGSWTKAAEIYDVIEPATGAVLARAGSADAAIVARTAATARAAQASWAACAADVRASIFPKAAALAREHWQTIVTWIMRESGSSRGKAEFELSVTVKAIELAGAMPHQAPGLVLPSGSVRLNLARRRPRGVVGVILRLPA